MKIFAVIAAGGSGNRMNAGENKIFLQVGSKSVLQRSMLLFNEFIDLMVIAYRPEDEKRIREIVSDVEVSYKILLTPGGDTRQRSVLNGLNTLVSKAGPVNIEDIVLIHDAARCLTHRSIIQNVIDSCIHFDSGVAAIPAVNTMKYADREKKVRYTVDRTDLFEIQTPQGFRLLELTKAYLQADRDGFEATDDASVMEHIGLPIRLVQGSKMNVKVTEKEDLIMINALLSQKMPSVRIGFGYDVHRLTENRKLILCGVEIPHTLGLLGHSDADVALHALIDALLGAAALGDIGIHFPDNSDEYKDISSMVLLEEVICKIQEAGYMLVNADITIAAQKPKLSPYISAMIRNISEAFSCDASQINIKATTTEKLGFEGREEGISAQAVCLICKI